MLKEKKAFILEGMESPESVAGAIFSPDRSAILLTQRRDVPVWVLPGGGIEAEETAEEAILREIVEETGFHVKTARLVGMYFPMNRLARRTCLYECAITGGNMTLSDETRQIRFFPLDNLPELIPPPYREWIADALKENAPFVQRELRSVSYANLLKNFFLHPSLVLRFLLARMGWAVNSKE